MTGTDAPFFTIFDLILSKPAVSVTSRSPVPLPLPMSLETMVSEIVRLSKQSDDYFILAAEKLVEFKARVEKGELGFGIDWMEWLKEHTKLKESRIHDLLKVGKATDKSRALEDLRRGNRLRAKKSRDKRSERELSTDRRLLLKVTRKVPEQEVLDQLTRYRTSYPELFDPTNTTH